MSNPSDHQRPEAIFGSPVPNLPRRAVAPLIDDGRDAIVNNLTHIMPLYGVSSRGR